MKKTQTYRRIGFGFVTALLTIGLAGCDKPENVARDSIAAGSGAIKDAQQKYILECTATPSNPVCRAINRSVYAQNAAITGLETYCQLSPSQLISQDTVTGAVTVDVHNCQPVQTAGQGLRSAVTNLNQAINELKSALKAAKPTKSGLIEPLDEKPVGPAPWQAGLTLSPEALSIALLGLKRLFEDLTKGKVKDVAEDSIDAVQGAIDEFEKFHGTPVTLEQLEGMRLHTLWPDADPAPVTDQPPPTS